MRTKKLICTTEDIKDLKPSEKETLFSLFSEYYNNVNLQQFESDLKNKEVIFVLRDKKTFEIKGFSTIVKLTTQMNGKEIRGYFSGDTVIDQEYWGQGALGVAFLKFLFLQKLKKPFSPLYWFLISKGYKTYLLMANNFKEYYPRYDQDIPKDKKQILDSFGKELYQDYYYPEKGIISFTGHSINTSKDCLKDSITPITKEMILGNRKIRYFADQNPNWQKGDELACLAQMTLLMPFQYQAKVLRKKIIRIFGQLSLPIIQRKKL